ncbi:MAG: SDR family NAD(P)-dependent oxidoreductase [Bacteroidota bacterium]
MKTVLITGGSSGIGFEITRYFAKAGYQILWVSLLEEELKLAQSNLKKEIPELSLEYLTLDLSQPDAAQKVYDWVKSQPGDLEVLINNAGFGTFGFAHEISFEKEVSMIQLNVMNLFQLTRLFLKEMLEKNTGTIINISSNTSFQPVPKMSAYAATKAFVKHYSQSLAEEMKALKTAVRVITVCPAAIKDTPFKQAAQMNKVKTFDSFTATTKEEVAKDVWRAFSKGKSFIASGAGLRRVMWMAPFLPASLVQFMLRDELKEKK